MNARVSDNGWNLQATTCQGVSVCITPKGVPIVVIGRRVIILRPAAEMPHVFRLTL